MMRWILPLALFAAVTAAQDPNEKQAPPAKKKTNELHQKIMELLPKLQSENDETRRTAEQELIQAVWTIKFTRPIGSLTLPTERAIRIVVPDQGSSETIRGTANEDGKTIRYELKSLGRGQYLLKTTEKEESKDGSSTSTSTETGTLAQLRKKHKFLRHAGGVMFGLTGNVAEWIPHAFAVRAFGSVTRVGDELRHHLELPAGAGLLLRQVKPETRLAKLGLKRFDILVRAGDEVLDDPKQVKLLDKPDVAVEYIRRGKKKRLVTPKE